LVAAWASSFDALSADQLRAQYQTEIESVLRRVDVSAIAGTEAVDIERLERRRL